MKKFQINNGTNNISNKNCVIVRNVSFVSIGERIALPIRFSESNRKLEMNPKASRTSAPLGSIRIEENSFAFGSVETEGGRRFISA